MDKELADNAADGTITACLYVADMRRGEFCRSSCKLVAPTGKDDAWKPPELVFTVTFDGAVSRQTSAQRAAA